MTTTNVLIVKTGNSNPAVRLPLGDYDKWFIQTLGRDNRHYDVLPAHEGAPLPRSARSWDAVIVTGSPSSVTEGAPWMRAWGEWLLEAALGGAPVLGVCFGHQLLARTLGAKVAKNRLGREIGTVTCALTKEGRGDPLFDGVADRFLVNATHEDIVVEAPSGLTRLAGNDNTALQAFSYGKNLRAVQFHPEIDAAVMRAMLQARRAQLGDRMVALNAGVRPTPAGKRILENFLRHFA